MSGRMREMAVLVMFTPGKATIFFHSATKFISFVIKMKDVRQYVKSCFLRHISPKFRKKSQPTLKTDCWGEGLGCSLIGIYVHLFPRKLPVLPALVERTVVSLRGIRTEGVG